MKRALTVKEKEIEPKRNKQNVNKCYLIPEEELYLKASPHTRRFAPNPNDQSNPN